MIRDTIEGIEINTPYELMFYIGVYRAGNFELQVQDCKEEHFDEFLNNRINADISREDMYKIYQFLKREFEGK